MLKGVLHYEMEYETSCFASLDSIKPGTQQLFELQNLQDYYSTITSYMSKEK